MGNCVCNKWSSIEKNTFPDFSYDGKKCRAKVVDIYDGDTGRIVFREGCSMKQYKFRLFGVDTPEMKPPIKMKNRDKEIKKAKKAKEYVANKILNEVVWVEMMKFDKYGRILIKIYPSYWNKTSINEELLEKGYGKAYFGGTK